MDLCVSHGYFQCTMPSEDRDGLFSNSNINTYQIWAILFNFILTFDACVPVYVCFLTKNLNSKSMETPFGRKKKTKKKTKEVSQPATDLFQTKQKEELWRLLSEKKKKS